jgi:hypothetical protein
MIKRIVILKRPVFNIVNIPRKSSDSSLGVGNKTVTYNTEARNRNSLFSPANFYSPID